MIGVRMKTEENFELLTDNEKTALENSIQQTVRQTIRAKQPKRAGFWVALPLDIAGVGLIGYGVYQNITIDNLNNDGNYGEVPKHEKIRNICYIVGGAVLASGICIHILF